MFNFDSFTGLPSEAPGEMQRGTWVPGKFGVASGLTEPQKVIARIEQDIGGAEKLSHTLQGWFNETLTPELAAAALPAMLIDVDSDIYISAVQALDWMFAHRLVRVGTLVGYDDFMDYACTQKAVLGVEHTSHGNRTVHHFEDPDFFEAGEPKAHLEISIKYGVDFRCVAGPCAVPTHRKCDIHAATFGVVFMVVNIGGKPNHGFEMSREQFRDYREHQPWCNFLHKSHKYRTFYAP